MPNSQIFFFFKSGCFSPSKRYNAVNFEDLILNLVCIFFYEGFKHIYVHTCVPIFRFFFNFKINLHIFQKHHFLQTVISVIDLRIPYTCLFPPMFADWPPENGFPMFSPYLPRLAKEEFVFPQSLQDSVSQALHVFLFQHLCSSFIMCWNHLLTGHHLMPM